MAAKKSLQREIQPMPPTVRAALRERGLVEAYRSRPDYQQNDYLGWIARGVREETRQKRLEQMLDELERGGVYMKMRWAPQKERIARPAAKKKKAPKRTKRKATRR